MLYQSYVRASEFHVLIAVVYEIRPSDGVSTFPLAHLVQIYIKLIEVGCEIRSKFVFLE